MATMIRGDMPADLFEDNLRTWFEDEGDQLTPIYPQLYNMNTSDKAYEDDYSVVGLGLFNQKNERSRIVEDQFAALYTTRYTMVRYAKAIRISHELQADMRYPIIEKMIRSFRGLAESTKEYSAALPFNRAFNGAYPWNATANKALLAVDHACADGTTWSNRLAVDSDLSTTTIQDDLILLRGTKNWRGLKTRFKPSGILIPIQSEWLLAELLDSRERPDTADRAVNVVNRLGLKQIVWDELTDADAHFMVATRHEGNWFDREDLDSGVEDIAQTGGKRGDKYYYATMRYVCGFSDPHGLIGTPGAG